MKVFAIIVTYNPDEKKVFSLVKVCSQNNIYVILVDNSENDELSSKLEFSNEIIIKLGQNRGIAFAQNVGIKEAIALGAEIIMFFDQDAEIEGDFFSTVLEPFKVNKNIVIGPRIIDKFTNKEIGAFKLNRFGIPKRIYSKEGIDSYSVDLIISSGMTTSVEVLQKISFLDEDLFIDFVDFEWLLRCKQNNIPILVKPQAVLKHSIGISQKGKNTFIKNIHSPERIYYQIRNTFLLLRKGNIPFGYKIYIIITSIIHKVFLIIIRKEKKKYIQFFLKGIIDGIRGKTGKNINKLT